MNAEKGAATLPEFAISPIHGARPDNTLKKVEIITRTIGPVSGGCPTGGRLGDRLRD